jgi:hypothetical protein
LKNAQESINKLKLQVSCDSVVELDRFSASKTALVCKLVQALPEISINLSIEATKVLLNERKCQQKSLKYYELSFIKDKVKFKCLRKIVTIPIYRSNMQTEKVQQKGG